MKSKLLFLCLGLLAGLILFLDPLHIHLLDDALRGNGRVESVTSGPEEGLWTCGMHPDVIQEEPGICPICRMDLVPLKSGEAHRDHADHVTDGSLYTCPMHPDILQEKPGECPICGMDLVPGKGEESPPGELWVCPIHPEITQEKPGTCYVCDTELVREGLPSPAGGQMNNPAGEKRREDGTVVTVDPSVVQKMNVTMEPVRRRDITSKIRTVGYVDYNQETMVTVTTKYQGWIEEVFVNYPGQQVRNAGHAIQEGIFCVHVKMSEVAH